jgi:hypothetical protein
VAAVPLQQMVAEFPVGMLVKGWLDRRTQPLIWARLRAWLRGGDCPESGEIVQPRYDKLDRIWPGGIIVGVGFAIGRNRP